MNIFTASLFINKFLKSSIKNIYAYQNRKFTDTNQYRLSNAFILKNILTSYKFSFSS